MRKIIIGLMVFGFVSIAHADNSCSEAWQCTYTWEYGGQTIETVGIGKSKIDAAINAEAKCSAQDNCAIYASSQHVPKCAQF